MPAAVTIVYSKAKAIAASQFLDCNDYIQVYSLQAESSEEQLQVLPIANTLVSKAYTMLNMF